MADEFERDIGSSIFPSENYQDLEKNRIWIQEAVKRLQLVILPKLDDAERKFLSATAKEKNMRIHELLKQAEEDCFKMLTEEDNEAIQRQLNSLHYYFKKSEKYWKTVQEYVDNSLAGNNQNIEPLDDDFFKIANSLSLAEQQRKSQKERIQKEITKNKDYYIKYQLYLSLSHIDKISRLFTEWKEYWGQKNAIYFTAMKKGISPKILEFEMQRERYSLEDAKIGRKVREGGLKGAKRASLQSKKEERMKKVFELYQEYRAKYEGKKETVIIKMIDNDIVISTSSIYRYLKKGLY